MSQNITSEGTDRCGRCNRVLKNPTARQVGFGATCYRKLFGGTFAKTAKSTTDECKGCKPVPAFPGFDDDIVCSIGPDGTPRVNVPHRIVHHSPTGFAWGYAGSGPAELALNALSMYIGEEAAKDGGLYQEFKRRFIATLPEEGGTIKYGDIKKFLDEQGLGAAGEASA